MKRRNGFQCKAPCTTNFALQQLWCWPFYWYGKSWTKFNCTALYELCIQLFKNLIFSFPLLIAILEKSLQVLTVQIFYIKPAAGVQRRKNEGFQLYGLWATDQTPCANKWSSSPPTKMKQKLDPTILTPESYMQPPHNKIQPAPHPHPLQQPQLSIKYTQTVKIKPCHPLK